MTEPLDDAVTYISTPDVQADAGADAPRLSPGQSFGPYVIDRLLGRGGMGEVYEAQHLDHGRRVAIKILNQRLAGPDDRARFLREGQIAASLSHPNTVYVFGSEEIDGTAVIAMELVTGGTLKDLVERDGPLVPTAAADAALQIVAGLAAAHACGIMHRDVKPANCFVEPGGSVKVGDFGLSTPTIAPDLTQCAEPAGFQGTPQFAAPEQLRGQPLDARADIYAVGATLYYLLTGRPPFDDRQLLALLTRIASEKPAPPKHPGAAIPRGLSSLVLACLAKDPAGRPATYAALEKSLRPFGSGLPTPARLSLRLVAGAIDRLLLVVATAPFGLIPLLQLTGTDNVSATVGYAEPGSAQSPGWAAIAVTVVSLVYYGLLEGLGGATLGKRVCGITVASTSGDAVGVARAFARAVIYLASQWLPLVPVMAGAMTGASAFASADGAVAKTFGVLAAAATVLLFTTIRPRNGWAAWQDLATGTRVIVRQIREARAPLALPEAAPAPPTHARRRIGPFDLVAPLATAGDVQTLLAEDGTLKRAVWLRVLPPGAPGVDTARADVGRPGRLRWMGGRRDEAEAWDAYEAPDGAAFLTVCAAPQPWPVVKHWLADLARELAAAEDDGTLPPLALDRVWITRGSQARLLDFPAPGVGGEEGEAVRTPQPSAQRFLAAVADRALGAHAAEHAAASADPLPALARPTLDLLAHDGCRSMDDVAARMSALAAGQDRVTRGRRAASIVLANVPLLFTLIGLLVIAPTALRVLQPGFITMAHCLAELQAVEDKTDAESVAKRRGFEAYLAAGHGTTLADEETWSDIRTRSLLAQLRPAARRALAGGPPANDAEVAAASVAANTCHESSSETRATALRVASMVPAVILLITAVAALLSAFFFRGGILLRLLGLAVVTRDGRRVGRLRAVWRACVA